MRPAIVDAQERCGDWEIDTIIGKDQKGAILTMTERKTGFLLMEKMKFGKQAEPLAKAVIRLLTCYKNTVHTITSDNGTEFAEHELMAKKLNADYYFAHPYSSWERGLNEYTNKLIRQYIIKGSSFDLYDETFIRLIKNKINRRPREKLGFQTPLKIFFCIFELICRICNLNLPARILVWNAISPMIETFSAIRFITITVMLTFLLPNSKKVTYFHIVIFI